MPTAMKSGAAANGSAGNDDKILREEIIESQKSQADFLKWKLISVAAVASASLGFSLPSNSATDSARLLLCLVPLICSYVDLISLHLMIRILTIGIFLKLSGNQYERFVFEVRKLSAANPFVFEAVALHGSSLVFNIIILGLGFGLQGPNWPQHLLMAYMVAGGLGVGATVLLWVQYASRAKEVVREAELAFQASQKSI
ncbi:MAG: hypothetical protein JWP89_2460 [Schlesneria sp.]|nr:hypothetical protein [Schlesneria sp.]